MAVSIFTVLLTTACGARTGLRVPRDASHPDRAAADAPVVVDSGPPDLGPPDLGPPDAGPPDYGPSCTPRPDGCLARELCGDGLDQNCDGRVDEGCPCTPGTVQRCFEGPPGRRNVGACTDGSQTCTSAAVWGTCEGGIGPRPSVCNGQDNLCDGCSAQRDCPIDCPSPGDSRIPDGTPFSPITYDGRAFYPGPTPRAWSWRVDGGPCDAFGLDRPSYLLDGASSQIARFTPQLSGDYTVTLGIVTGEGRTLTCSWVTHVRGPGLRIEMCYPESRTADLDLHVQRTSTAEPWYLDGLGAFNPSPAVCNWARCEATVRLPDPLRGGIRTDWGYAPSALDACNRGPQGSQWQTVGFCANPRLDIDNNLVEGIGLPENINIDRPRDGEGFRIMVQNFTGTVTRPVVNVYCGGARTATFGAAPDELVNFQGDEGRVAVGAMWRVADVRVRTGAGGETAGCDVTALHPPGRMTGYWVTQNDRRW